jgi:hypothetical protein
MHHHFKQFLFSTYFPFLTFLHYLILRFGMFKSKKKSSYIFRSVTFSAPSVQLIHPKTHGFSVFSHQFKSLQYARLHSNNFFQSTAFSYRCSSVFIFQQQQLKFHSIQLSSVLAASISNDFFLFPDYYTN